MPDGAEFLIAGIAVVALLLAPLASRLILRRGEAMSAEIYGGGPNDDASRGERQWVDENAELRAEVRELVLATNARRERAGKPPLDVEQEIERRLRRAAN